MTKQEIAKKILDLMNYPGNSIVVALLNLAKEIEKDPDKQIPIKPIHFHQVYPKHDWKLYDGEIDTWAWESGYHNGPFCKRCHCAPCEHCNPDYDEEECIVDEKHCPSCDKQVTSTDKFCHNCGQALDWSVTQT